VYASKVAGLGHFPYGNEGTLIEIDRIDLWIHVVIRLRNGRPVQ